MSTTREQKGGNACFESLSRWVEKYSSHPVRPNDIVTKVTTMRNGIPTVTRNRLADNPAKCVQALSQLKKEYRSENVVRASLRSTVTLDVETEGYDSIKVETTVLCVEMATPTGKNRRHVELRA